MQAMLPEDSGELILYKTKMEEEMKVHNNEINSFIKLVFYRYFLYWWGIKVRNLKRHFKKCGIQFTKYFKMQFNWLREEEEEEEEDLFTKQNMYTNDKAIMAHSQVRYI